MNKQPFAFKKQQCIVLALALGWLLSFAALLYFVYERNWVAGGLFVVLLPLVRWALFHFFPHLSRFLGYGRVDDEIPESTKVARVTVTFYSFFSCPFCPIVLQRLEALQKVMDFTLEKIDVTLKPQILVSKGIWSVPVVEVGGKRLIGNLTTAQLAEFISPQNVSIAAA